MGFKIGILRIFTQHTVNKRQT